MRGSVPHTGLVYEVEGKGPPLVLLHAFPLNLRMWDLQVKAFSGSHSMIRFDNRGFGASPKGSGALTMEQIADDAASLLDHLGFEKVVLGGCSMGGYAAFAFVRRHPARLLGLILADTRAGADTEEGRTRRVDLARRTREQGLDPVVAAFLPGLLGKTSHVERPELVARVEHLMREVSPEGAANALLGLGERADSRPTLGSISVPTLILCGEEDTLTPPSESQAMHAGIHGSRIEILPRAGHLANLEQPTPFNEAVRDFLSAIETPRAKRPRKRPRAKMPRSKSRPARKARR